MRIPFNIPYESGKETRYIEEAFKNKQLSGDGPFTRRASELLEQIFCVKQALLTHSCTAALEMCALLLDIKCGDEIIMPSYTFVSTANAFVLCGATPVFVDINPLTQNISIECIKQAITPNTKAIVVVHYAGISCNMHELVDVANDANAVLIEDAAQAIYAKYDDKPLGSFGDLATVSFHETKNISCGEGGCLLINNERFSQRAEIIREKGTNRSLFRQGQVDKYTWVDKGSSYLPGEISAAFLYSQLEEGERITSYRVQHWNAYRNQFKCLERNNKCSLMHVPIKSIHNAHMYYLIMNSKHERNKFIQYMMEKEIGCLFHYVPLHSSPAGLKYGKVSGVMNNTNRAGDCLVRLPMSPTIDTTIVINAVLDFFA